MAYRSIRRVIGETSLERKCRILFVFCLALLVFLAFWWVERIAEDLIKETAIRKGRDLVELALLRHHWTDVATRDPDNLEGSRDWQEFLRHVARDLGTQEYDWKVLALEELPWADLPADSREDETLRGLKAEFQEQLRTNSLRADAQLPTGTTEDAISTEDPTADPARPRGPSVVPEAGGSGSPHDKKPVFRFETIADSKDFHYYQPVYWSDSCIVCHQEFEAVDALGRADVALFSDPATYPFRVIKVTIPGEETRDAITESRAILGAIGILTVFMAMVVLYVIIRYVVVKPLKHLRDVSEEIGRGNTKLRAEINTNDEFEELADAFNRMLRHLTEKESELRQVNKDLDAKLDQLAQLNMRLHEMNRLKSDFLTNMSHELRTPLNSIIGFSELLHGIDTLNDKQKRYAQNIRQSGRSLLDMINDILDLAKIEAGKMDVRPSEFRIDALIGGQCDLVRSLSEEKNIDLGIDIRPDLPLVFQDQSKVQQIVLNLLSNAIKFTPEGGRITVSAERDSQDQLVIAVADTGVGIAEEDREVIFEKFRQSSNLDGEGNLTREYSGTGLGLSIVKELCILLGGEVTFESVLGKGSTFRATLPWKLPFAGGRETEFDTQLEELARSQTFDATEGQEGTPLPKLPAATTSQ
jgi:signal transduction histidine kinase